MNLPDITNDGPAIESNKDSEPVQSELTSKRLTAGEIYSRASLRRMFDISDATIQTGVFRPKGSASIWLFVTEKKTGDRTPYRDLLEGDTLRWQGQMAGRTDGRIINHQAQGQELLVFYRKSKTELPGYGFRYEGPFVYIRHSSERPTNFVLRRAGNVMDAVSWDAADNEVFNPTNLEDARRRTLKTITQRRGQKRFRQSLLAAYDGKCAVTECCVPDVLEAAHIHPYRGPKTNHVTNGLLLRADIHTLFDCNLIAIQPDSMTVLTRESLRDSDYWAYNRRPLRLPRNPAEQPSADALRMRFAAAGN